MLNIYYMTDTILSIKNEMKWDLLNVIEMIYFGSKHPIPFVLYSFCLDVLFLISASW